MSRAALYKGLGVGLMSFGDGLQKQMAETARQRREESLLAMKRQWQMEDREDEREWQTGLLDRTEALQAAQRAEDRDHDLARLQQAEDVRRGGVVHDRALTASEREADEARTQEMHDADVRYREAQTASAEALAESRLRQQDNLEANQTAVQRNLGIQTVTRTTEYAREEAQSYFSIDRNSPPSIKFFRDRFEPLADSLGITEETPLQEARDAVADWVYSNEMERLASRLEAVGHTIGPAAAASGFGLLDAGQPAVDPTEEWNAAMEAIEAGAPVELVIQGMRQRGVPEDIIQQFQSGF